MTIHTPIESPGRVDKKYVVLKMMFFTTKIHHLPFESYKKQIQ
jgi:hypothetical protein